MEEVPSGLEISMGLVLQLSAFRSDMVALVGDSVGLSTTGANGSVLQS